MLNFLYGILLIVVILPLLQSIMETVVTFFNYLSTTIAAKTMRIQSQLDKEQAEMQFELQEKQMENQEQMPAIGFHVIDEEALEYEEEEE